MRWFVLTLLVVTCAASVAVLATMASAGRGATELVETPVAVGPWQLAWDETMSLPKVEQASQMAALRTVAAGASGLLGVLCLLTVLGLWRQRLRLHRREDAVHWAVGARRIQLAARLLGEGWRWAVVALLGSTAAAFAVQGLLEGTFPGTAEIPAQAAAGLIVGTALSVVLLRWEAGAGLAAARAGVRTPALLSSPTAVAALGFAVLTGVGLLVRHGPGSGAGAPVEDRTVTGVSLNAVPEGRRGDGLSAWLARADRTFGVASAGAVRGVGHSVDVWVDCGDCYEGGLPLPIRVVRAEVHAVASDTFPHLGLEVVGGRDFDERLDSRASGGVIVSRAMAMRHFEDGEAVGRPIRVGEGDWLPVVGVVTDAHDVRDHTEFAVYLPIAPWAPAEVEVIVSARSVGGAQGSSPAPEETDAEGGSSRAPEVVASLAMALATAPEGAEVGATRSDDEIFAAHGWFARLLGVLGLTAYALVFLGVWLGGRSEAFAMAFDVSLRRAVGARHRDLRRHFIGSSVKRLGVAFGVGAWLSLFLGAGLNEAYGSIPQIDGVAWLAAAVLVALAYVVGISPVFARTVGTSPAVGLARGS